MGILTADCAPILFYDPINMIVGACHAGWKGALTGIIENTLIKMESIGSKKIISDVQLVHALVNNLTKLEKIFITNLYLSKVLPISFLKKNQKIEVNIHSL